MKENNAIIHMVFFTLKHAKGSEQEHRFLADGKATLTSIPQVRNFQVSRQVSSKCDYDFGFSMRFEDAAAYAAYNAHEKHVAFVQNRWVKEVDRFQEIDLEDWSEQK